MDALGVIETEARTGALKLADAVLATANVTLAGMEYVGAARVVRSRHGDAGAVSAANRMEALSLVHVILLSHDSNPNYKAEQSLPGQKSS